MEVSIYLFFSILYEVKKILYKFPDGIKRRREEVPRSFAEFRGVSRLRALSSIARTFIDYARFQRMHP
jgi:hypothetical protein